MRIRGSLYCTQFLQLLAMVGFSKANPLTNYASKEQSAILCFRAKSTRTGTQISFLRETDGLDATATVFYWSTWTLNGQLEECATSDESELTAYYSSTCQGDPSSVTYEISELRVNISRLLGPDSPCEPHTTGPNSVQRRRREVDEHLQVSSGAKIRQKRAWVFPGTFWCGRGSSAVDYEQLGMFEGADRCCREHDHCNSTIHAFSANYGVFNPSLFTVSLCDCDRRFQECLQDVNDTISSMVGYTYFSVLKIPCFDLVQRRRCTQLSWFGICTSVQVAAMAIFQDPIPYNASGPAPENGGAPALPGYRVTDRPPTRGNQTPSKRKQTKPVGPRRSCDPGAPPRGDIFQLSESAWRECAKAPLRPEPTPQRQGPVPSIQTPSKSTSLASGATGGQDDLLTMVQGWKAKKGAISATQSIMTDALTPSYRFISSEQKVKQIKPAIRPKVKPTIHARVKPTTQAKVKPTTQAKVKPTVHVRVKPTTQAKIKPPTQAEVKPITQTKIMATAQVQASIPQTRTTPFNITAASYAQKGPKRRKQPKYRKHCGPLEPPRGDNYLPSHRKGNACHRMERSSKDKVTIRTTSISPTFSPLPQLDKETFPTRTHLPTLHFTVRPEQENMSTKTSLKKSMKSEKGKSPTKSTSKLMLGLATSSITNIQDGEYNSTMKISKSEKTRSSLSPKLMPPSEPSAPSFMDITSSSKPQATSPTNDSSTSSNLQTISSLSKEFQPKGTPLICDSVRILDDCKYKIHPMEKRYGLHNTESTTIYHCDCIQRLAGQKHLKETLFIQLLWKFVSQSCLADAKECRNNSKECPMVLSKATDLVLPLKKTGDMEKETLKSQRPEKFAQRGIPVRLHRRCLRILNPKPIFRGVPKIVQSGKNST